MAAPTHWNKLRGMWGRKRSITPQETMEILGQQQPITITTTETTIVVNNYVMSCQGHRKKRSDFPFLLASILG